MRLRIYIIFFTILIICPALSLPANGLAVAGQKCTKIGSTKIISEWNMQFKCIKIGKKLVWDSGVLYNLPDPEWLKSYSSISKISRSSPNLLTYSPTLISPNVDPVLAFQLLQYQNLASSYWKQQGFESSYPVHVLILSEKDESIYGEYAKEYKTNCDLCVSMQWFSPNFATKFQGTVLVENFDSNIRGMSDPSGLTILYLIGSRNVSSNPRWRSDLSTAFTHEYQHLIQFSELQGWKNFSKMACWFNEGFPAFFEDALYFENVKEKNKIIKLREPGPSEDWILSRRNIRLWFTKQVFQNMLNKNWNSVNKNWNSVEENESIVNNFFSITDVRNSDGCRQTDYGRGHGSFISQYFYDDFGGKAFLDLLRNTNNAGDWNSGFKETTGITYSDWLNNRVVPEFTKTLT